MKTVQYSVKELKELFGGKKVSPQLDFDFEEVSQEEQEDQEFTSTTYISEAQTQFPAIIQNNQITVIESEEDSTHILKPSPIAEIEYREEVPANEQLTMRIAKEVYGIKTVPNNLCFTLENQPVYISHKIEIEYGYEDISSYEDLATAIKESVPAWMIAIDELFKRIIFNYIYGNDQANIKDFELIVKNNEIMLTPAHNLINTAIHTQDEVFTLENGLSEYITPSDIYQETGYPCKTDFIRFGEAIGLPEARIERTINMFSKLQSEVFEMINNSNLSTNDLKMRYLKVIKERKMRFSLI